MILYIFFSSLFIFLSVYFLVLKLRDKEFRILSKYIRNSEIDKIKFRFFRDKTLDNWEVLLLNGFSFYNYNEDSILEVLLRVYFKNLLNRKGKEEIEEFINDLFVNWDDLFFTKYEHLKLFFLKNRIRQSNYINYYRDFLTMYILEIIFTNRKLRQRERIFYKIKINIWR